MSDRWFDPSSNSQALNKTVGAVCGRLGLAAMLLLLAAGCTATKGAQAPGLAEGSLGRTSVLLMPLDVEMYELTLGVTEPKADWSRAAKAAVDRAVSSALQQRASEVVRYVEPSTPDPEETQLLKLHEAVGKSIVAFKIGNIELPTKEGKFDWTLGRDVAALRNRYGTDHALFVFARDTIASAGRKAAGIFLALLGGGYRTGGTMIGFASLVDLRTGDVVWFNAAGRKVGDLRDQESATIIVDNILEDFPIGVSEP